MWWLYNVEFKYDDSIFFFFFFSPTNTQGWNHEHVKVLVPKGAPEFQFMCLICRRQETDVKHCPEWWRPDINDAVWSLLLITVLHSSATESCYWVINNEDGIKALVGWMCLFLMVFCSLLRFSVELPSEEPPEKLPAHSSDAISVVIILPLKTRRVGGLEIVALVLKGFKLSVRIPTCKWHNVGCPFIGDEALSVTLLKRSSQTRGRLTQHNANIGTADLVSLKCHILWRPMSH